MTEKTAFQKCLENLAESYEIKIRSYSGRGMYGRSCLAIIVERDATFDIFQIGVVVGNDVDIDPYDLRGMRLDSMGLDTVYYWPHIPYVEEAGYDEEETNE